MMVGRTNMLRKVIASFFLLLFLSLTGFLIYSALKPEILPIGSFMPELNYLTETGQKQLEPDSSLNTIIVYFHSKCDYCQYELNVFDEFLNKFINNRIILLTPEEDFFAKEKMNSWPSLVNSSKVFWGIVDKKEFSKTFGGKSFPTTFIFDNQGVLSSKLFGEAKLDKIVSELQKKTGGPEGRVSGAN